ncbi:MULTISPECIES: ROK family protein [unclassified Microbacterium]|uniref:ROK family protein n=1 Tax=unclassified Microbacterium TaxID=2609290 RepID=UPI001656E265|nr:MULTISPECIES: ROK family protein [unclassified Microbacterium]MDH5134890.1 ROK family protein [Microbacterium sp. RD10]MDH5137822.1 ROK family protein [Microbacterium sp. RD11]MDH5146764.1 ROK family protein [Microbacterium sp. RD12]MDH5155809.1 ROK family protein [Microbacterium sp. RD06]MDH5167934.1 ROK family protein [Microbacterium sp. RD02]
MIVPASADRAGRPLRVGLDVGGTKIDAVAVDPAGTILARLRRPTGWGEDAVVDSIVSTVAALAEESGLPLSAVGSAGIGIPGLVDAETGRVLHAVNLGVESLDLAARAEHALGVPFRVENDVKAAALGAAVLSDVAGSMAYLNLGTGVAAGIVVDGRIWRGARGTAGEVGHLSVDPRGRLCGCGQRGCVETFCGGGALAKAWGRPGALPVKDIVEAADAGDPHAQALQADLFFGAAAAVRVLVLSADVETVVIGGGLTALGGRLAAGVRAALHAGAEASPFLKSLRLDERIELLPAGSPAAAFGAALVGASISEKEIVPHG